MSKLFKSFALFAVLFCATRASFAQTTYPSLSFACTNLSTPISVNVVYSKLTGGVFTGNQTTFNYLTTGTNYIPAFSSPINSYRIESLTFTFNGNVYTISRATLEMYGEYHWISTPGNILHLYVLGSGNYSFSQS